MPDTSQPGTPVSLDPFADAGTDLAARRTGMAFQRTRMSADRTLMAVIRTSLSLISFGFTIAQVFGKLADRGALGDAAAPRRFGTALVGLGITLLVVGIIYHVGFMKELRVQRAECVDAHLIHGQSRFPVSFTLLVAVALLAVGLLAIASLVFGMGPLS